MSGVQKVQGIVETKGAMPILSNLLISTDNEGIYIQATDLEIGILFYLAVTGIGVYGIVLAGWSSNSKYSLLGGIRASAQMLSYEIALGLSLVGVLLVSDGGHLAGLVLFGNEVLPMAKSTFYFVLFVMVAVDLVQGRYQKKLMRERERIEKTVHQHAAAEPVSTKG